MLADASSAVTALVALAPFSALDTFNRIIDAAGGPFNGAAKERKTAETFSRFSLRAWLRIERPATSRSTCPYNNLI
ncbi:MAG: hypothetical protein ABSD49_10690 [Candidatus Bathyarchaeia archaeon]